MNNRPDHYDPPEHERVYFKSKRTGDRAYLVRRGGRDALRLDRPMQEIIRPLSSDWVPDEVVRHMSRMQMARIAFEADRALCVALGLIVEAKKEWAMMPEEKRIGFATNGPSGGQPSDLRARVRLFARTMGELELMFGERNAR